MWKKKPNPQESKGSTFTTHGMTGQSLSPYDQAHTTGYLSGCFQRTTGSPVSSSDRKFMPNLRRRIKNPKNRT